MPTVDISRLKHRVASSKHLAPSRRTAAKLPSLILHEAGKANRLVAAEERAGPARRRVVIHNPTPPVAL